MKVHFPSGFGGVVQPRSKSVQWEKAFSSSFHIKATEKKATKEGYLTCIQVTGRAAFLNHLLHTEPLDARLGELPNF